MGPGHCDLAQDDGQDGAPILFTWRAVSKSSLVVAVVAAVIASAVVAGQGVLMATVVIAGPGVATAVARLVAMEVVEGLSAALGERSVIAVTRIVAVVDVAVEVVAAVIPVARSDEDSVHKPIGPVVAVGRALIGSIVKSRRGRPAPLQN